MEVKAGPAMSIYELPVSKSGGPCPTGEKQKASEQMSTDTLTTEQLDELARLHAAATAGEWGNIGWMYNTSLDEGNVVVLNNVDTLASFEYEADAAFIAAANNAMPALLSLARSAADAQRDALELRGLLLPLLESKLYEEWEQGNIGQYEYDDGGDWEWEQTLNWAKNTDLEQFDQQYDDADPTNEWVVAYRAVRGPLARSAAAAEAQPAGEGAARRAKG